MKKLLFLGLLALFSSEVISQTIAQIRNSPLSSIVTVRGVVVNGPELGGIRYLQDGTAGISIYGSNISSIQRGDSVVATGTLTSYNNLLEITPVSSFTVLNSNNPITVTAIQTSQIAEALEGELVRIDSCQFNTPGGTFSGNTNYQMSKNGQSFTIRIGNNNPLVGSVIPAGVLNLQSVLSQFCGSPASGCTTGYQLLPRDANDIINTANIYLTQLPALSNINPSGFTLTWATNVAGNPSFVRYGRTPQLEQGIVSASGAAAPSANLSGLQAGQIYYVKAFSVLGTDTASSPIRVYATQSAQSGPIRAYFNRDVDTSVATLEPAVYLPNDIADTLAAYIDRCQQTLDIAIYNWDGVTNQGARIVQAVNDAYARNVKVRIIFDGSTNNSSYQMLNLNIPVVASPQGANYTIMHNKFVIMDANSVDPRKSVVWTGSTNWTVTQLTTDANNVIVFQDQAIARAYTLEFNEMWGDTLPGSAAVPANAKFGSFKTDNTPHEFNVGGKRVEVYFSPSDGVNSKILNTINTANQSLEFCQMLITRSDLSSRISNVVSTAGIQPNSYGLLDDTSGTSAVNAYNLLNTALGNHFQLDQHGWILHHKYLVVDQNASASDPVVLTGSHNWSTSADTRNDENTVVVHDARLANLYHQEFVRRWAERNDPTAGLAQFSLGQGFSLFPNPAQEQAWVRFEESNPEPATLIMHDLLGQPLWKRNLYGTLKGQAIRIDGLSTGCYLITLTQGNKRISQKLFVP